MAASWSPEICQRAWLFAARTHHGQRYPGTDLPYLVHVGAVAMELLASLQNEPAVEPDLAVQCALLHDVIEDTAVTSAILIAEFGERVAAGVLALSKDDRLPKEQQLPDSLERIRRQPPEIWRVKLADRIANLQPPPAHWPMEKCQRYRDESLLILDDLGVASPWLAQRLRTRLKEYERFTGPA
jgi:(p)ppGpp synthase/HD superfamily hydrolase